MREIKEVSIKNIIPKKNREDLDPKLLKIKKEPILVEKAGKRFYKIVDGNHRYFKQLDSNKKTIMVEVRDYHPI